MSDAPVTDALLEALAESSTTMGPTELADAIGSTRASVSQLLKKLIHEGRVTKAHRGAYRLVDSSSEAANGSGSSPNTPSAHLRGGDDAVPEAGADYVVVETISVEAAAGAGAEVEYEVVTDQTYLPRWYVRDVIGAGSGQEVKRIRIAGESMLPTLRPGEHVYIVLFEPGQEPIDGSVCIVRGPHGLSVKRIVYGFESQGDGEATYTVTLWSDNPEYPRDVIPLEVFRRDYYPIAFVGAAEKAL